MACSVDNIVPFTAEAIAAFARKERDHTKANILKSPIVGCKYMNRKNTKILRHAVTDAKDKRHACTVEGCGEKCTSNDNLRAHMIWKHPHLVEEAKRN